MTPTELQSQKVLVAGLGVSGRSVARYLVNKGVPFDAVDERITSASVAADELLTGRLVFNEFTGDRIAPYDVIVLSPGIPRAHPAIAAALARGQHVIGDIELFAHVVNAPVVAVTGSNGKSTVVAWAADVLVACGVEAIACGNIGEPVLDALADGVDAYVVELSSYQLESCDALQPLIASVLNVSEDHLDRYTTLDAYAKVKTRVYRRAMHCLVNADDPRTWFASPAKGSSTADVRAFSAQIAHTKNESTEDVTRAPYTTRDGFSLLRKNNQVWLCDGAKPVLPVSDLTLPGEHNVANALAVLGLLAPLDLDRDAVAAALPLFSGLPHRTQFVRERHGVRFYNDSKGTNVDACIKAIDAMPGPVVLIAGGQGKGADFHPLAGVAKRCVKAAILIGEDREQLAEVLTPITRVELVDSLANAVQRAAALADVGDVVLLSPACASFDMFKSFEARGEQFMSAVEGLAA